MDKRKNSNTAKLDQVRACLVDGDSVEAIAVKFNMSNSHIYRIKTAMNRGEVKLKRSSLASCVGHIKNGLPFRRVSWPEKIYYYCAIDEPDKWFVKVNAENGCELITYSVDLSIDDLTAQDWVVLTWESVGGHIVDANKKADEQEQWMR